MNMADAQGPSWAPALRQLFTPPGLASGASAGGAAGGKKMFKVAVTGASGMIGTALVKALKGKGN